MNMAVGQGFMLSTPLQLANAYASVVNGGVVWKPHVVQSVRDASGTEVLSNDAEVVRRLDIDPATVSMFRQDLTLIPSMGTAQEPSPTSAPDWSRWGQDGYDQGDRPGTRPHSSLEWLRWTTRATWW